MKRIIISCWLQVQTVKGSRNCLKEMIEVVKCSTSVKQDQKQDQFSDKHVAMVCENNKE